MDIKTFRRATPSSVGRSGKIGQDRSAGFVYSFLSIELSTLILIFTSRMGRKPAASGASSDLS